MLAVLAATAFTTSAGAEVVDDNPAATSRAPGQVSVFIRGADGALNVSDLQNGSFTPWQSLGGYLDSGPGGAGRTTDNTDMFVRGGDGVLYQKSWVAGS